MTLEHDPGILHRPGVWYLACRRCAQAYEVAVAMGQVVEYRAPGTDDEPWPFPEPVITHEQSRLAVLWIVLGLGLMVLLAVVVRRG